MEATLPDFAISSDPLPKRRDRGDYDRDCSVRKRTDPRPFETGDF